MYDARGADQLIGRVAPDVELRTRARYFTGYGPDVYPSERTDDCGIVQVELDSTELGELGDLPEDDRGNAPLVTLEKP